MIAWIPFQTPLALPGGWVLWLILPLSLSVTIVYKTLRAEHASRIPRDVAFAMASVLLGLTALGAGLWALIRFWP